MITPLKLFGPPDNLGVFELQKKTSEDVLISNWLGYLDSNQGNARFRVWCLTAWLYPNQPLNNTTPFSKMQPFFENSFLETHPYSLYH